MLEYIGKYYDQIFTMLVDHCKLVFVSILISFVLAFALSIVARRFKAMSGVLLALFIGVYCIPSLALFAFLIPFFGLGQPTAILALVLYNQVLLIRSILAAFKSVPSSVSEAAKGMGIGFLNGLRKVELPLALPAILGGLRVATISTSGIVTVAALINAGGLGVLLFDGIRTNNFDKIWLGVILVCSFTLLLNWGLSVLEKRSLRIARGER
ncbi:ABC transporter permease [Cohnella pontilimi]|uniref:ABC transporter permease n=1 Tax=Cohnella pontilimi TaxID=2564100 RepID=A0A4U0FBU5_9BACL|nr:ABC transporter permease [Cohnella pontilimi]TJY40682.1 ABC transporter permease [Cohnella pontilimi]